MKRSAFALLLSLFCIQLNAQASSLVLTEFMASNISTITDEDGDSSDWIEIWNSSSSTVALDGWHLTDDSEDMAKWTFPSTNLLADQRIVVFASSKNRLTPGHQLHTNFKLDADGSYLALVPPDGTVATEFNYPEQRGDVAFGQAAPVIKQTLITPTAPISVFVPTNDNLGTSWTSVGFSETGWKNGANGVGYGTVDSPAPPDAGRVLWLAADIGVGTNTTGNVVSWSDAGGTNGNWIETVRGTPQSTNAVFPQGQRKVIRFDNNIDGFALRNDASLRLNPISVYVVASVDAGAQSAIFIGDYEDVNGFALGISDATAQRVKWFTTPSGDVFDDGVASSSVGNLTAEKNYLMSATFSPGSNTKVLRVLTENATNEFSAAGTFHTQNAYTAGTQLTIGNLDFGRQFLNGDIAEILVYNSVSQDQRDAVEKYLLNKYFLPQPSLPSSLAGTDIRTNMQGISSSAFTRNGFQLNANASFNKLTLNIQYDDGFVAYLDGQEVARRNAPGTSGTPLTYDSIALSNRSSENARDAEAIDLTASVSSLNSGNHVLAIHGLNDTINSADFLLIPSLVSETLSNPTVSIGFLQTATPGNANDTDSYFGIVANPQFSVPHGFYDSPFSVAISCATTNAIIRYTLDGTIPSLSNGTNYTGPLTLSATTKIRAVAFQTGWLPSEVVTRTYIFVNDVVAQSPTGLKPTGWPTSPLSSGQVMQYGMDRRIVTNSAYSTLIKDGLKSIPSMSVVMDLNDLTGPEGIYTNPGGDGSDWERPASVELINPDGTEGFQINAGIRIRGGQSRMLSNPKHAFRLFFRGKYGASSLDYRLFTNSPVSHFEKIDLRMDQNDSWSFIGDCCGDPSKAIYLRDVVTRDAQLAMGQPGTRSSYYHLYLNGIYWGLCNSQERPEADFAASYFGGTSKDYDVIKVDWGPFTVYATDGDMTAWTIFYNLVKSGVSTEASYQRLLGNNPDGTRNPSYPVFLDPDNLIDFMLLTMYGANLDSPISTFSGHPNNWYAIRSRTGESGFKFIIHDAEFTMWDVNANRLAPYSNAGDFSVADSSPEWLWNRLLANPTFKMRVADRIQKHFFGNGALTTTSMKARFLARKAEIDLPIIAESARWGDARRPTPYTRNIEWLALVNQLAVNANCYFDLRTGIVLNQFRGANLFPSLSAPVFNQSGGAVPAGFSLSISNPNAPSTVYYTIDGSDPRAADGTVRPGAFAYSTPIAINSPTTVRARVQSGAVWSAITEGLFLPPQNLTGLMITELMYHPPTVGTTNGDEFEFLEMKNFGTNTLNLSGLSFTAGITFTFTNGTTLSPGQYFVIARNPGAFSAKYPTTVLNGIYTGKLDNSGEAITFSHPTGAPLFTLLYDDHAPWTTLVDGTGLSLQYIDTSTNMNDPVNWVAAPPSPGGPVSGVTVEAPGIITHPLSLSVVQGNPATFNVVVSGTGPMSYQWYFNGSALFGATQKTFTRTNCQPADVGTYSFTASNQLGTVTSSNATLTIMVVPQFTMQPQSITNDLGTNVSFSVSATGASPLTYQWLKNGAPLADGGRISGATTATLSISTIATNDAGIYSAVVTDIVGSNTSSGALLVVNTDLTIPTVTVTTPTAAQRIFDGPLLVNGLFNMRGTARDNVRLDKVVYSFNNGPWQTALGVSNWWADLALAVGTNQVKVKSIDRAGKESIPVLRTFSYVVSNRLHLATNGSGSVLTWTNSIATNGMWLEIGRNYTLKAVPGSGYVFKDWTGDRFATNASFTFMMSSNLTLQANFITNQCLPAAGIYNGLFSENDQVLQENAGFLNLTLKTNGAFSGKIVIDGDSFSLGGSFSPLGVGRVIVSRFKQGKSTLTVSFQLDYENNPNQIGGTISDGAWTSDIIMVRSVFSATRLATNFMGSYTMLVPKGSSNGPSGYGSALLKVATNGSVSVSGTLADNTKFSQTIPVAEAGQVPLFATVYPAKYVVANPTNTLRYTNSGYKGSVIGWVNLSSNLVTGELNWIKKPWTNIYPNGFTNASEVIGSRYVPPTTKKAAVAYTNAIFTISDGNLPQTITKTATLNSNNVFVVSLPNSNTLKATITPATGALQGTFVTGGKTRSFTGVVVQDQKVGGATFVGTNQTGAVEVNFTP